MNICRQSWLGKVTPRRTVGVQLITTEGSSGTTICEISARRDDLQY
jgi:hypothetical protein